MADKNILKLSPSSLNSFLECPRCFWLKFKKGIGRPKGPSSTLPNGMDLSLKKYYDDIRRAGLPKELEGRLPGKLLQDKAKITEMRKNGFGFQLNDEVWFGGALDDALELPDSSIIPLDNKTKGFPPQQTHWTQLKQMASYTLILRENGFRTRNIAYLAHWFLDHKNMKSNNPLRFNIVVEEVKTDPDEIKEVILSAVKALKGDMPKIGQKGGVKSDEPCSFCIYRELVI